MCARRPSGAEPNPARFTTRKLTEQRGLQKARPPRTPPTQICLWSSRPRTESRAGLCWVRAVRLQTPLRSDLDLQDQEPPRASEEQPKPWGVTVRARELCCNSGGSCRACTLQTRWRGSSWSQPSAHLLPRARPPSRGSPATRARRPPPPPGPTWRCRASGLRGCTPTDGTGSSAVHGPGVSVVIIPLRGVRGLRTRLVAS